MESLQSKQGFVKLCFYFILMVMAAYCVYSIAAASRQMYWDFPNYYVSARLISEGEPVQQFYDNDWFEARGHDMGIDRTARFNPFPPITSLVMLPLSGLEPMAAKRVWIGINVLLLIATIALWRKAFRLEWASSAFLILLTGLALGMNFRLGQIYLLVLFLLLVVYLAFQKSRLNLSASVLAVIASLKYFPVVFIAGFFKKGYLFRFSVAIVLLLGLQWLIFGIEGFEAYVQVLLNHLNGNIDGQGQHLVQFQSFDSFFSNVFLTDPDTGAQALINWPAGKTVGKVLTLLLTGASAAYVFKKVNSSSVEGKGDYYLAIAGFASYVVLPATASYHMILLLFPLGVLIKREMGQSSFGQLVLLLLLFGIACNSGALGFTNSRFEGIGLVLNYPRLWAVVLLYIVAMRMILQAVARPTQANALSNDFRSLWRL